MGENIYKTLLQENLKKNINTGTMPAVEPVEDFFERSVAINSWFAIGRFKVDGHTIGYLFHLMSMRRPGNPDVLNANFAITDETNKIYYSEDNVYPLENCEFNRDGGNISIKTPSGSLSGNLFNMHWEAKMPHGSIELDLIPYGMPIYNAGSGHFTSPFEKPFNQYSIPDLHTTGKMTIDDKIYNITEESGRSWFDRQWQDEGKDFTSTQWAWSWMDLNLDNGEVLSLWDMENKTYGKNNCWATVMHTDGTQATFMVELLKKDANEFFTSEKSGQRYPTHWTVRIPEIQAVLDVSPVVKESEIVSKVPFLNKYEGASIISGTYKGEKVSGYCYVELLGEWK